MLGSRRSVRRLGTHGIYFLWNWNAERLAGLWILYSNYSTKELVCERKIRQAWKQASCQASRVGLSWNQVFWSRSGHHTAPVSAHRCQSSCASAEHTSAGFQTDRDSKSAGSGPPLLTPIPPSLCSKYFQAAWFLIRCLLRAMKGELGLVLRSTKGCLVLKLWRQGLQMFPNIWRCCFRTGCPALESWVRTGPLTLAGYLPSLNTQEHVGNGVHYTMRDSIEDPTY